GVGGGGGEGGVGVGVGDVEGAGRRGLHLLHHWLSTSAPLRCLFVATHRETDAATSDAFDEAVADFHRLDGVERILVTGFDRDGVRAFVEAAAGVSIDAVPPAAGSGVPRPPGRDPLLPPRVWGALPPA